MVSPAALSIILTTFAEGPERNRALAVWGGPSRARAARWGCSSAGLIVEVPELALGVFRQRADRRRRAGADSEDRALRAAPRRVSKGGYDVEGAVTSTLGTIALVFTLIKADSWGWTSGRTLAGFAIAAVLIAAFIQIERRHRDPLVPLRIFSNRSLAAGRRDLLLVAAALFGVFFFCTLYLQQVLGYSALKTGVAYLPLSLTLIGASALASTSSTASHPSRCLTVGLLIATGVSFFSRSIRRPRSKPRAARP